MHEGSSQSHAFDGLKSSAAHHSLGFRSCYCVASTYLSISWLFSTHPGSLAIYSLLRECRHADFSNVSIFQNLELDNMFEHVPIIFLEILSIFWHFLTFFDLFGQF